MVPIKRSNIPKTKPQLLSLFSVLFLLCILMCWPSAYAQSNEAENQNEADIQEKTTQAPQSDNIEVIGVTGSNLDSAMRAFKSGDFAVAEIEFKKNALCALRVERNKEAFVTGLQNSSIDSALQTSASVQNNPNSDSNGGANPSASGALSGIGGRSSNQEERPVIRERSCDNRAYQLYMAGLSQIQLGRVDEAEKNLKTAAFLNTDIYDAHYRIALFELLRDDKKSAKKRLSKIKAALKRCKKCEAKPDIEGQIVFLQKAIAGEIKLK